MAHKEKLESIKLEHHRLANQDRADARDTEREILESPNAPMKTKLFRQRFALFITICCFAYVTAVTFIPAAFEVELNQRVVDILTGCMISKLNTIVEYYFGGSYGEVDHMSTTQVGQYQPNTQLTYRY
jgi:fatty acid desaturase